MPPRQPLHCLVFSDRLVPMSAHDGLPFLGELILFLALAGVLIPLLQRRAINPVLGFLALGVLSHHFGNRDRKSVV